MGTRTSFLNHIIWVGHERLLNWFLVFAFFNITQAYGILIQSLSSVMPWCLSTSVSSVTSTVVFN